jgi:hypothetical protein
MNGLVLVVMMMSQMGQFGALSAKDNVCAKWSPYPWVFSDSDRIWVCIDLRTHNQVPTPKGKALDTFTYKGYAILHQNDEIELTSSGNPMFPFGSVLRASWNISDNWLSEISIDDSYGGEAFLYYGKGSHIWEFGNGGIVDDVWYLTTGTKGEMLALWDNTWTNPVISISSKNK